MATAFDKERQRIQQEYQKYQRQLATERREAEASITGAAREQLSELERRQQELLGELRTEEQRRKRLVSIGQRLPRVPIEQEKKRIEAEAKKVEVDIEKAKKEAAEELKKAVEEPKKELEEWREESLGELQKAEAVFQAENIELNTGEWVSRVDFQKLSKEHQDKLKSLGIEKFNQAMAKQVSEAEQEQTQAVKEFEAQHVELDTGEWVTRESFELLDPKLQLTLKKEGVAEFTKQWEAAHVKLDTGEWTSRESFETLSPEHQVLLIQVGVDEFNRQQEAISAYVEPEQAFQNLQASGSIPKFAVYKGFDAKTGEISYGLPDFWEVPIADVKPTPELRGQFEKDFLSLDLATQAAVIEAATGWREGYNQIPTPDLTKKQQEEFLKAKHERILGYYEHVLLKQPNPTEVLQDMREAYAKGEKSALIGLIPIYGTIYNWENMSPAWRAVSIVCDALIVASFVTAGVQALRAAKIAPIRTAAAQLTKAETATSKAMVQKLATTYGDDVAKAYTTATKAQNAYVKQLAAIEELARKGRVVTQAQRLKLVNLETALRKAGNVVGSKLKLQAGFDSPEIARMMTTFGDDYIRNAKAAVGGLKPTNIKALQAAVTKAEAALKVAQTKYPKDASKWVDLLYDLMLKQAKLAQVHTGSIEAIHKQLLAAREAGKTTEVARLEKLLRDAIKSMEIEWAEMLSRGGGVAVAAPWAPPVGAPPRLVTPITQLAPAVAATMIKLAGIEAAEPTVAPTEIPTVSPMVMPDIAPMVAPIVKATPEVAGVTQAEVKAISEAAVKAATQAATEGLTQAEIKAATETAAQTQVKVATKTQVKAIVKTATKLGLRWRLLLLQDKQKRRPKGKERPTYPAGTIAWKQGMYWKIIPPPYDLKKPIHSVVAPKGVIRLEGTPQETLTFIKGKLPFSDVSFDLGVVDGFIDVEKRKIHFTGGGLETVVGRRKPEPTRGISLEKVLPRKTVPRKRRAPTNKALRRKIDKVVTV